MGYTGERRRRNDRPSNGARLGPTRRRVSTLESMVRDSSAKVVSGASRPVHEIESISTHSMVPPFTNECGTGHGNAQARRQSRSVSECRRH